MKQIGDYFYKTIWSMSGNSLITGDYIQNLLLQLILESFNHYNKYALSTYQESSSPKAQPQDENPPDQLNVIDTIVYEIDDHIKIQVDIPVSINPHQLRVFYSDNKLIIRGWPNGHDKIIELEGNPAVQSSTVAVQGNMLEIIVPKQTT